MKALSRISTAVLLCLILAAPAAAERFKQTINISVSPNPTIGSTSSHNPLTYKVEGETERAETYVVYMHVLGLPEEAACPAEPNGNYQQITIPEVKVHESSVDPKHFEGKGTFPWNTYEQKGEYRICAYLRYKGEHAIEDETVISTTVLTVTESYAEAVAKEEAAAKRKAEEEAAASADTIRLNIEPQTAVQGKSVSYKVTGTDTTIKGEEVWAYARIPGTSKCQSVGEEENSIKGHILGTEINEPTFEYTGSVPNELHESPGTYLACAYIVLGGPKPTIRAASSFTFVVVSQLQHEEEVTAKHEAEEEAAATKKREEEAAAKATPPAPAPSSAPVAPVAALTSLTQTPPLVQPLTSAQRLAKAVAKCKKQYKHNKKKRVVCEKQAKKKYGPKPKPHDRRNAQLTSTLLLGP